MMAINLRTTLALAATVFAGMATGAQEPAGTDLRFDAASIRPAPATGPPISGTTIRDNRLRGTNVTVYGLVVGAYYDATLVSADQFIGGPDWIRSERYVIDAVAARKSTRAEFNVMLRNLLTDRFGLVVRRDRRELPVFVMRLARDDGRLGPKLTRVDVDCTETRAAFARLETTAPREPGTAPPCDTLTVSDRTGTRMVGRAVEMAQLAQRLVGYLGGVVVDRTGLTGVFDFEIQFVREVAGLAPDAAPALSDAVTLATALREQLGMRVERETAPVDVLVIESAERPTPN